MLLIEKSRDGFEEKYARLFLAILHGAIISALRRNALKPKTNFGLFIFHLLSEKTKKPYTHGHPYVKEG